MICEVCRQNDADIIFKTVTGNQVATKAMCLSCAHNMQQDMIKMFMALGFKKEQVEDTQPIAETKPAMPRYICAQCGRHYDTLDEHTMAGCAACYDAMRADLDKQPAADANQAENTKAEPRYPAETSGDSDFLRDLRYHLMEAIIKENYEEAARLRNQISIYENEINKA